MPLPVAPKFATLLIASAPLVTLLGATAGLSGCGFALRGYDAPMRFEASRTALSIEDTRVAFPLELPLTRRLRALGVTVVDASDRVQTDARPYSSSTYSRTDGNTDSNRDNSTHNHDASAVAIDTGTQEQRPSQTMDERTQPQSTALITVKNVRFRRYELVGVLTEIRLALSADVTYQTTQQGQPVTLSNPITVERSYQYNEASVSTDDQQGSQIRDWLYDSLARRISDQYVAIGLPQVMPASTDTDTYRQDRADSPLVVTPTLK